LTFVAEGYAMRVSEKKRAVLDRITRLEEAIVKGHEYLECGMHARWRGFQPLFVCKMRDGKELPPHKDWVRNVFLPRHERALKHAKKVLAKLK
jgi:hypothetical protein